MLKEECHKFEGTVTVGTKGQIVIPAEARKKLGIEPGEKLLVYTTYDKIVGLIRADDIDEFMLFMSNKFAHMQEQVNKAKKS